MGEMGRKEWLSDHPLCTCFIAVSAGYIESVDSFGSRSQEFEVSAELHDGDNTCSIDYLVRDKEEVKESLTAISRVRKALDYLEGRIKEECSHLMEDPDGKASEVNGGVGYVSIERTIERTEADWRISESPAVPEAEANGSSNPSGEKG